MNEGHVSHEKRNLLIILVILCVLAVVLSVLVVINVVNQSTGEEVDHTSSRPDVSEMSKEDIEYYNYVDDYDAVEAQVKKMLSQSPIDADGIRDLYISKINQYANNGEIDRATSFIYAMVDAFSSKGLKQEALDAMLTIDLSIYEEPEQYRQYTNIIELAQEVGDQETEEKYKALREEVRELYEIDDGISKDAEKETGDLTDGVVVDEGGI